MLQFREKEVLAYGERQAFLISSGIGHLFACCGFDEPVRHLSEQFLQNLHKLWLTQSHFVV